MRAAYKQLQRSEGVGRGRLPDVAAQFHVGNIGGRQQPRRALRARGCRSAAAGQTTSGNGRRMRDYVSVKRCNVECLTTVVIRAPALVKPARLHFARATRALTGRYNNMCVSEAFCPNIQPRAHARFTGLTTPAQRIINVTRIPRQEKEKVRSAITY